MSRLYTTQGSIKKEFFFDEIIVCLFIYFFNYFLKRNSNPQSLNEFSFCLSISHQLSKSFGSRYQRAVLDGLISLSHILAEKICQGNHDVWKKWIEPMLNLNFNNSLDRIEEFMTELISRIHTLNQNILLSKNDGESEAAEFYILCEFISSFQFLVDPRSLKDDDDGGDDDGGGDDQSCEMEENNSNDGNHYSNSARTCSSSNSTCYDDDDDVIVLIPALHVVPIDDLFDVLISQPLLKLQDYRYIYIIVFYNLYIHSNIIIYYDSISSHMAYYIYLSFIQ